MKKIVFLSPVETSCVPPSPQNLFPPKVKDCSFEIGDEVSFSDLRIRQHKSDGMFYLDGTIAGGSLDGCYVFNIPATAVECVKNRPIKKASCVVANTWSRMPTWAKVADCIIFSVLLAFIAKVVFRKIA